MPAWFDSSGTAWVADGIEGAEIIQAFYRNLASQVAAGQGANSFYGGLMQNMVGMLQHGLPLQSTQRTQSKVMGQTMMGGTSESRVTGVFLFDREEAECGTSVIPEEEDYEITYIGAGGMPGGTGAAGTGTAGSGAGAGSGSAPGTAGPGGTAQGGQVAQPCDCSCAAFARLQQEGESMKGDSPEDQAKAMCMMQCMQQFMACAMQGGR